MSSQGFVNSLVNPIGRSGRRTAERTRTLKNREFCCTTLVRYLALGALGLVASGLPGCAFSDNIAHLSSPAALGPEPAQIWSRPAELGVDVLWDENLQGEAFTTKLLGFTIAGDDADISVIQATPFAIFFKPDFDDSALARIAVAHAVDQSATSQGMYVLRTERKGINLFLYSNERVKVAGKGVKLDDLGPVSVERSDRYHQILALPRGSSKAPVSDFRDRVLKSLPFAGWLAD